MGTPTTLTIPTNLPEGRFIPSPFEPWMPEDGKAELVRRRTVVSRLGPLYAAANQLLLSTVVQHPYAFEESSQFEYTNMLPDKIERIRLSTVLGRTTTWSCIRSSDNETEGKITEIDHVSRRLLVWDATYILPEREISPDRARKDPTGSSVVFVDTIDTLNDLAQYFAKPGIEPSAV